MGALWVARSTLFHNNYNTTTVFKSIEDRGPSGTISPRPVCRTGRHKNYVQDAGLYVLVEAGLSAARGFVGKLHQHTRRSRVTAPADLDPPKVKVKVRVRVRDRSGVGLVWADVQG